MAAVAALAAAGSAAAVAVPFFFFLSSRTGRSLSPRAEISIPVSCWTMAATSSWALVAAAVPVFADAAAAAEACGSSS